MGCMSRCAKYFLCFFNFVFFIAGGAALAVGIWLIVDRASFTNLVAKMDPEDLLTKTDADVINMIAYILIVAGALTFIVSFLGYCGAMFESRCLLSVYGILILLVIVLECVAVGLAFGLKGETETGTKTILKETIKYYNSGTQAEAVTAAWDGIMRQMKCCGVDGYQDFHNATNWSRQNGHMVPRACCKLTDQNTIDESCPTSPSAQNSYFQTGCYKAISEAIEKNIGIVIGVAVALVFIEILVTVLALYLACCYWRPQHVYRCVEPPGNE